MSGISNASNHAIQGSDSGPRYTSNSSSTHSLAGRKTDKKYALRSYLQDHQAHEKLALGLQNATTFETAKVDEEEGKEKQV